MIFNYKYDTALWFILEADKKNRKDIIKLINELPSDLLEKIKKSIEEAKDYVSGDKIPDGVYDIVECEDNIFYYYTLNPAFGLSISKCKHDGENKEELFNIFLSPVDINCIESLDNYDDEFLGTLANNLRNYKDGKVVDSYDCIEREYEILKTPLGYCVLYTKELFYGEVDFPILKLVNIYGLPSDVTIEKINNMGLRLFK